jgi:hypothetical protein
MADLKIYKGRQVAKVFPGYGDKPFSGKVTERVASWSGAPRQNRSACRPLPGAACPLLSPEQHTRGAFTHACACGTPTQVVAVDAKLKDDRPFRVRPPDCIHTPMPTCPLPLHPPRCPMRPRCHHGERGDMI